MRIVESGKYIDGFCFLCYNEGCYKEMSIRHGSFFSKSKLPLKKLLLFIYMWSTNSSGPSILQELDISNNTMGDWSRFMREKITEYFINYPVRIGGIGKTVEIDETLVAKRKYHRGRLVEQVWVFGGVERSDVSGQVPKKSFAIIVPDRSRETLIPLIIRYIDPGTRIISDGWAAYSVIGDFNYTHEVVIHEENFVSPISGDIHTQNVEGMWSVLKRKLKRKGTHITPFIEEYIAEVLFRYQNGDRIFEVMLDLLKINLD